MHTTWTTECLRKVRSFPLYTWNTFNFVFFFLVTIDRFISKASFTGSMSKHNYENPEKIYSATTPGQSHIDLGNQGHIFPQSVKKPSRYWREFKLWSFLVAYTICCIALSVILATVINKFNAIESTAPRYTNGKLQLRVADITTLISAGLVVIKLLVTSSTFFAVWRCAYDLTHNTDAGLSKEQLSFMTRHRLPPWLKRPFGLPKGFRSWVISAILLLMLPHTFIAPLLSGAVDWNSVTVPDGLPVLVNSSNSLADSSVWYQYTAPPTYIDKRSQVLKVALGTTGLLWSDNSLVSANGTSLIGNGCRHMVNNNGLQAGSLQYNTILPCIKFHDIAWATSAEQIPDSYPNTAFQTTMSIVNDSISHYTNPGHAVVFDPNIPWNVNISTVPETGLPVPNSFSGSMALALVLANTYNCTNMGVNKFGNLMNTTAFPQYIYSWALGTCYIFANVTFTAGVSNSPMSKYLSPNVIEDQTPIDEVVFKPNTWVQESFWLLPDLMTTVSLANSTQIPTWYNVDSYVQSLIRQSYLGAWAALHQTFDEGGGEISYAAPAELRIQATVSYPRVFSWLAVSLLTSIGGILLLLLTSGKTEPAIPDCVSARIQEEKQDVKKVIRGLADLYSF